MTRLSAASASRQRKQTLKTQTQAREPTNSPPAWDHWRSQKCPILPRCTQPAALIKWKQRAGLFKTLISQRTFGETAMPLMKTSNPALTSKTFQNLPGTGYGGMIDAAARMSAGGTVNKTGLLFSARWPRPLGSGIFHPVAGLDRACPMISGRRHWRLHCGHVTVFKKEWSPVTAPHLCAARGPGARRPVGHLRFPLSRHRHSGRWPYLRHAVCASAGLSLGHDQGDAEISPRGRRCHGRHLAFLSLEVVLSFFHVHFLGHQWRKHHRHLFSLFVFGIAALNLVLDFDFIEQGVPMAPPSTWSGMAHSASWSRWSGSISRSFDFSRRCAAETRVEFVV